MSAPQRARPPVDALAHIRSLKAAAGLFLLLGWTGEPLHLQRAANLLGLHPDTTRRYLRRLEGLGLVHSSDNGSFALNAAGAGLLAGMYLAHRPLESNPAITTITTNRREAGGVEETGSISAVLPRLSDAIPRPADGFSRRPLPQAGAGNEDQAAYNAIWAALLQAGIGPNQRTRRLARMAHITPDYITGHYLQLERNGKGDEAGLLVTILESGVPAPALNALRHLADCNCERCRGLKYQKCPYCWEYPCTCAA